MWNDIKTQLQQYPERLKVARVLIENGLSVQNNKIYLNQIEIPPVRIARAAGVDRRTVNETLNTIKTNPELKLIFEEIRPAGHSLKEIAKHINLGVLEITPVNAKSPGILSMPFGPKELRILSAITLAAVMFPCWASLPRDLFEPSFKTRTGTPPACVGNDDKSNNLL
ncbi:MAG: hypothetical protein ABSD42_02350 [Candidatus Bathyarchaeia archaeon]